MERLLSSSHETARGEWLLATFAAAITGRLILLLGFGDDVRITGDSLPVFSHDGPGDAHRPVTFILLRLLTNGDSGRFPTGDSLPESDPPESRLILCWALPNTGDSGAVSHDGLDTPAIRLALLPGAAERRDAGA